MRVALVHDWLTGLRGGERVLDELARIFPDADLYTLVHVPGATTPRIDALAARKPMPVGAEDGRQALVLAEAALKSVKTGRPVKLSPPRRRA